MDGIKSSGCQVTTHNRTVIWLIKPIVCILQSLLCVRPSCSLELFHVARTPETHTRTPNFVHGQKFVRHVRVSEKGVVPDLVGGVIVGSVSKLTLPLD